MPIGTRWTSGSDTESDVHESLGEELAAVRDGRAQFE